MLEQAQALSVVLMMIVMLKMMMTIVWGRGRRGHAGCNLTRFYVTLCNENTRVRLHHC